VSSKALRDRMVSVLMRPRPMVRSGNYYGPQPRQLTAVRSEIDRTQIDQTQVVLVN